MALLDDTPRAATIAAIKDCYLAVLDRQNFKKCLAKIENRPVKKEADKKKAKKEEGARVSKKKRKESVGCFYLFVVAQSFAKLQNNFA